MLRRNGRSRWGSSNEGLEVGPSDPNATLTYPNSREPASVDPVPDGLLVQLQDGGHLGDGEKVVHGGGVATPKMFAGSACSARAAYAQIARKRGRTRSGPPSDAQTWCPTLVSTIPPPPTMTTEQLLFQAKTEWAATGSNRRLPARKRDLLHEPWVVSPAGEGWAEPGE
jgi:hypothetical protein